MKWNVCLITKYKQTTTTQKLAFLVSMFFLCFSITSILHWGWMATAIGFVSIVLLVILMVGYLAEKMKDNPPLPLTNLQKVEHIKESDWKKLNDYYKKETGKYAPPILGTPDEHAYFEWLKLQTTKYLELQSSVTIEDSIIEGIAHGDKNMEDY